MRLKGTMIANPIWIVLTAALILLPVVVSNPYIVSIMVFVAVYGILALSMSVLLSYAGLFTVVQPVFLGIGAYTAAILSLKGISPVAGIMIGALLVALIALLIGAPVLRLRGFYMACASFGILFIAQIAYVQLTGLTGGPNGLIGIPALSIGSWVVKGDTHFYYIAWTLCGLCLLLCTNIVHSRPGRAIQAARDSEIGAASLGVNIPKFRLQIFVITSVMAALAGGIYCFYLRYVAPPIFGFDLLVQLILMTVIGGTGKVWAPLLGCFVIMWLDEFLKAYLGQILPVMTGEVTAIFFGVIIIVILIFTPRGLVGLIDDVQRFLKRMTRHVQDPGSQR